MHRKLLLVAAMFVGLATLTAPVAQAAPQAAALQPVTINSPMTLNLPSSPNTGTFTVTRGGGGLICSSGTVLDTSYVWGTNVTPPAYVVVVDKTFTCGDGTGTIFFRLVARGNGQGEESFVWVVVGGTGSYTHLRGLGVGSTAFPTNEAVNTYRGFLVD